MQRFTGIRWFAGAAALVTAGLLLGADSAPSHSHYPFIHE